jgi:hypothetical protein
MKLFVMLIAVSFLLMPSLVFAWGPLTHVYLGSELLALGSLVPAGIYEIIRRYRKDFIYGNIMADIIVGKKYLPEHKNSHNWDIAFDLFKAAETKQQKSFVYGYMSHLAADTVAHNVYTADKKNFGHTLFELKADSIIDKKYWIQAREIDRKVQSRNDVFLESSLDGFIFSFKTNKRILNSMVFLSVFNRERVGDFIDKNLITSLPQRARIEKLHDQSLDRTLDLFQNWRRSKVIKENPNGISLRRRLLKKELASYLLKSHRKRIFQNIRYNL